MQCSKDLSLSASKNSNLIVFANDGSIQKLLVLVSQIALLHISMLMINKLVVLAKSLGT